MPQVVRATLGLFVVYVINIAFPILLVNRKPDKNIEKPIFLFFYVLIDKRKPTAGVGCLHLIGSLNLFRRQGFDYIVCSFRL